MAATFWLCVILVSTATSYVATLPLRWRLKGLENLCDMLARAMRGEFEKDE